MSKKTLIVVLVIVGLLFCAGIIVAGIVFIPKLISNIPGGNINIGGNNPAGVCEITNCHGMDIQCGNNPPDVCTEEYRIGDNCRQLASCTKTESSCSFVPSPDFTECKSCVEKCITKYNDPNNVSDQFTCESLCTNPAGSTGETSKIANPSASYCTNMGYEYDSIEGTCKFDNNNSCDGWDFYRGKCKTENSYCEQMGYTLEPIRESTSTSEYEYALCTFDDESVCAEEEYFRNTCDIGQCKGWKVEEGGCVN